MKYFLAFSYNVHDSSVSVADEHEVRLVLEAERVFGVKKKRCNRHEMERLIEMALTSVGADIGQVAAVGCTAYENEHLPPSLRHVEWMERATVEVLGRTFDALVLNHHLAHAASIYAFHGELARKEEDETIYVNVCDGGGDFGWCHRNYLYRAGKLTPGPMTPWHERFNSRFYDRLSRYLYGGLMGEGKLMALAAMGTFRQEMRALIEENHHVFSEAPYEETRALLTRHFPVTAGVISQNALDLAATAQELFEEGRLRAITELAPPEADLLLVGGASLNIVANTRIQRSRKEGARVFVPSCPDDTGQSLGCLLYLCFAELDLPVACRLPFLGHRDLGDQGEISPALAEKAYDHLMRGGILYLHRGPSEIGPRALGHRSIVALPTRRNVDLINHVIKEREFYRPVAPFVPAGKLEEWFGWNLPSPYMAFALEASPTFRALVPDVCHYDGTVRAQSIDEEDDPFLARLLERVEAGGHPPVLTNTSLNLNGMPIAATRRETMRIYEATKHLPVAVLFEEEFLRNA